MSTRGSRENQFWSRVGCKGISLTDLVVQGWSGSDGGTLVYVHGPYIQMYERYLIQLGSFSTYSLGRRCFLNLSLLPLNKVDTAVVTKKTISAFQ